MKKFFKEIGFDFYAQLMFLIMGITICITIGGDTYMGVALGWIAANMVYQIDSYAEKSKVK